jgi:hypothetical protein
MNSTIFAMLVSIRGGCPLRRVIARRSVLAVLLLISLSAGSVMGGSGREPGALLSDANPDFGIISTGSASSISITLSDLLSVPILVTGIFEEDAFCTDLQESLIPANGELILNIYCDPLHNIHYEDFLRVELNDKLVSLIAHVS